jgi:hypothetical protein
MFHLKEYTRIVVVISTCALVVIALAGWSASGSSNQNPVVVTNGSEQPVPIYAPKQILVTLDNSPGEPGIVLPVNNPVNDPFDPPEQGPAIGSGGFALATSHIGDPPQSAPAERYVIEEASADLKLSHGSRPLFIKLTTSVNGGQSKLFLPATFAGTDFTGQFDHYVVSQPIHLYADPNTDVTLEVSTTSQPGGQVTFDLSGGFVPVVSIP